MMYSDGKCTSKVRATNPSASASDAGERAAAGPEERQERADGSRAPPAMGDLFREDLGDVGLIGTELTGLGGELSILASLADAERHRRTFTGFPMVELPLTDSDDASSTPPDEEQWSQLRDSAENLDTSKIAALSSAFSNHISSPKHSKSSEGDHEASAPPMGQFLLPLVTQNVPEPSSGMVNMAKGIMQSLESEGRNYTLREVFFLWLSNYKEVLHKDPSDPRTLPSQRAVDVRKQIDDALKLLFLLAHCTDDEESQWVINEVNAKLNAQKSLLNDESVRPDDLAGLRELLDNAHKVIDIILIRLNNEPVGRRNSDTLTTLDDIEINNFDSIVDECSIKDTRLVKNITECINERLEDTDERVLQVSNDNDSMEEIEDGFATHDPGDGDGDVAMPDDESVGDLGDDAASSGNDKDKCDESDEAIKNMPVDILTKFESFNKFLENSPLRSSLERYMMTQIARREAESRQMSSSDDGSGAGDDSADGDEELPQKIFDCDSINTWERFIGGGDAARRQLCPGGCGNATACSRYRRQKGDGRGVANKVASRAGASSASRSRSGSAGDPAEAGVEGTAPASATKDARKDVERNPPDSARFIDLQWAWWELRALLACVWHAADRRGESDIAMGARPPCHCCRCALLRATMHPLQDLLKQMHESSESLEKCTCQRKRRTSVRGGVNRGRSKHREQAKQEKCKVCTSHNAESRLKLLGLLWGRGEPPSACCCRSKLPSGDTCKVTIYFKDPSLAPLRLDLAKDDTVDEVSEEEEEKVDPESEAFFTSCYKKFMNGDEDIPRGDEGVVPVCQRCRCVCGRPRFYCPKQRDISISENIDNFTRLAPQLLILRLDTLCAALCARHSARLAQLLAQGAVMTLLKELWRRAAAMRAGGLALSSILGPSRRRLATVCGRLLAPHRFLTAVYRAWADRAAASRVVHLSMLLLLGEEPPLTMDALRSFSSLLSMMTEAETLDADVTIFLGNYRQCERDDYLDRITSRYHALAQDCLARAAAAGLLEDDPCILPRGLAPESEMWDVCLRLGACLPRDPRDLEEFKRVVQAMLVCNTVGGFTHLAGRLVGGVLVGRLGKNSGNKEAEGGEPAAIQEPPPAAAGDDEAEDDDYWRSKRQLVEELLRERDHTRRMQGFEDLFKNDPALGGCQLQRDDERIVKKLDSVRSRPVKRKLKPHNPLQTATATDAPSIGTNGHSVPTHDYVDSSATEMNGENDPNMTNCSLDSGEETLLTTMPDKFVVKDVDLYERWGSTICLMQSSAECAVPGGRWECDRQLWRNSKSCPNIQHCSRRTEDGIAIMEAMTKLNLEAGREEHNNRSCMVDNATVESCIGPNHQSKNSQDTLETSDTTPSNLIPQMFVPLTSSVDPCIRIELKTQDSSDSNGDLCTRRECAIETITPEDRRILEDSLKKATAELEIEDQENLRAQMLECLNKMEILGLDEFKHKRACESASEDSGDVSSPPLHELSPMDQTPAYNAALNQNRRLLALNHTLRRGQTDISNLLNTANDIMAQEKSILKELIDYELSGVKKEEVETDELLDDVTVREAPPLPFLEENDLNQLEGTDDKEAWEYSPLSSPKRRKTLKEVIQNAQDSWLEEHCAAGFKPPDTGLVMQYISESDGIPDLINRILTHGNKYPSHNIWKIAEDHCFLTPDAKKQIKEARLAKSAKKQVCGKRKNGNLKKVSTIMYENKLALDASGELMKFEDPSKEEIMVEMLGHRDSANGFTQKEFQTKLFTASIQVVMRKVLKVMMCDDETELEALKLEGKDGCEYDVKVGNWMDGHCIDDYWDEIKSHFTSWRTFTLEQYWGLTEPCRKPANRAEYLKTDAKLREIQEEAEKMAVECKRNNRSGCYVCKDCESVKLKEADIQDDPIKKRAVKKSVANKASLETKSLSKANYITPVEHAMFVEKLQAVNKDYVDKLLKQNFTGEDWILTMNELQKLERKLKSAVGKNTSSSTAPTRNTDEAREAELLAGRGLSKLINQFSSKKTAPIETTTAPAKQDLNAKIVKADDAACVCESGKCTCDKDRQFSELKLKAKRIEDTLKMLKEKDGEEVKGADVKEEAQVKKPAEDTRAKVLNDAPKPDAKPKDDADTSRKRTIKKMVISNTQNKSKAVIAVKEDVPEAVEEPQTPPVPADKLPDSKKSPRFRPRIASDVQIVNGVAMKGGVPIKDGVTIRDIIGYREPIIHPSKLAPEPAVKAAPLVPAAKPKPAAPVSRPAEADHHHQHVCTVNHGGDTCGGNPETGRCSQHPASPRPDQPCNCCYCTVFGHAPPVTTPVSRNFNETRERLRSILNRKKQRCRPAGSQSSQGDSETSDGSKISVKDKSEEPPGSALTNQTAVPTNGKAEQPSVGSNKPMPANTAKLVKTNQPAAVAADTKKPTQPSNTVDPIKPNHAPQQKPGPVSKANPIQHAAQTVQKSNIVQKPKAKADLPVINQVPPAARPPNQDIKSIKEATNISIRNKDGTNLGSLRMTEVTRLPGGLRGELAREQIVREVVAREQVAMAREQHAREQAAREQAAKEKAAKEQAAKEQAAREQEKTELGIEEQNSKNAKKYKLVACNESKAIQTEKPRSQSQQSPAPNPTHSPAPQQQKPPVQAVKKSAVANAPAPSEANPRPKSVYSRVGQPGVASTEWQTMTASTTTTTSRDSSIFNSTSSVCSGCSGYRVRVEDTRDLNMLLEFIEGPGRTVDKVKKQAKKARQKAKKLLERLLLEQGELKGQMAALSSGLTKLRGEASRLEKLLAVSTQKKKTGKKGNKKRQERCAAEEERVLTVQSAAREARARADDAEAALQTATKRLIRVQQTIDNVPEVLRQQLSAEIKSQGGATRPKQPSPPHEPAGHSPAPAERVAPAAMQAQPNVGGETKPDQCMVTIKRVMMPDRSGPSVTITPKGSDKPIYFFQQNGAVTQRPECGAGDRSDPPEACSNKQKKASPSWEATLAQINALSQSKKKPKDKAPKAESKPDPPKQQQQPSKKHNQIHAASTASSVIPSRSASTVSEPSSAELNAAPSKKQRKLLERRMREQQAEQERIQREMEEKVAKRQKEKADRNNKGQEKPPQKTKEVKKTDSDEIVVSMVQLKNAVKKAFDADDKVNGKKVKEEAKNAKKAADASEVVLGSFSGGKAAKQKQQRAEPKTRPAERPAVSSPGLRVVGGKGTLKQNPRTAVQQTASASVKKPTPLQPQSSTNTHVRSLPPKTSAQQHSSNGPYHLNSDITIELANTKKDSGQTPSSSTGSGPVEQQQQHSKSGPVSCSIMEQLRNGVQVADLKLPPGITLTWVDPSKQQPNPTPKTAIPVVKLSNVAPECRPSPPVVAPPALIMVDTAKLQAARDLKAQQSSQPHQQQQQQSGEPRNKSKKSKKKSKKPPPNVPQTSETSVHSAGRSAGGMVTLRNPMFHPTLPAVSVSSLQPSGQRVGESIRIPDPIPMPPNACQATITPTSNGMFTIRNPLMSMVHQQNMMALGGQAKEGCQAVPSPVLLASQSKDDKDASREITGRMADLGLKPAAPVSLNFAPTSSSRDRGYSLFDTDGAPGEPDRAPPTPISPKLLRKADSRHAARPEPVGTPRKVEEESHEGFYTPFGHSEQDKLFGSLLFQNSRDEQPYTDSAKQSVWSPVTGNEDHLRMQQQFYTKVDGCTGTQAGLQQQNTVEISLVTPDQKQPSSTPAIVNAPNPHQYSSNGRGPVGFANPVGGKPGWSSAIYPPAPYQPQQEYPGQQNQNYYHHAYSQFGQQGCNQPPLRSSHSSSSSGLMTGSVISSGANSVYDSVSNSSSNSPADSAVNQDVIESGVANLHVQNSPPETGRIDGRNYADFSPYVAMLQQQSMPNCYNPMFGRIGVSESPNSERISELLAATRERMPDLSAYNNFGYGMVPQNQFPTNYQGRMPDFASNENHYTINSMAARVSSEFTPVESVFSGSNRMPTPQGEYVAPEPPCGVRKPAPDVFSDNWAQRELSLTDDPPRFGTYGPIGSVSGGPNHPDARAAVGVIGSHRVPNGLQKTEDYYGVDTRSIFAPDQSITNLNELESTDRDIESFKRFDFYFQPPKNKPKINLNLRDITMPKTRDK